MVMKTSRNYPCEQLYSLAYQLFLLIKQKVALIISFITLATNFFSIQIRKLLPPSTALITYYKGAPIIMIMRPKASLTDC